MEFSFSVDKTTQAPVKDCVALRRHKGGTVKYAVLSPVTRWHGGPMQGQLTCTDSIIAYQPGK